MMSRPLVWPPIPHVAAIAPLFSWVKSGPSPCWPLLPMLFHAPLHMGLGPAPHSRLRSTISGRHGRRQLRNRPFEPHPLKTLWPPAINKVLCNCCLLPYKNLHSMRKGPSLINPVQSGSWSSAWGVRGGKTHRKASQQVSARDRPSVEVGVPCSTRS